MNAARQIAIVGVAAFGLGMGAMEILHAQSATPPAYLVADVKVSNPATFKTYLAKVPAAYAPFGGQALARGGTVVPLEGAPPAGGITIIRFDSLEKAKAFWNSPAYREIATLRHQAAQSRIFLVEGLAQ